jgi:pimeloyl-ACP methyl ester carboxylesterase
MKIRLLFTLILSFCIHTSAYAGGHTTVLIHGYLGDGSAWRPLGIVNELQWAHWEDGGHLFPFGPVSFVPPMSQNQNRVVYTVTLPSEAPLSYQAAWLEYYLDALQHKHPSNDFILVGHSAGGVVARLTMVRSDFPIKALITIASPNLGTPEAEDALDLSNSPFSWIAPFLGLGTINRSEILYAELVREFPATPLFGINRSQHPDAQYISIIRLRDGIVPPYSQDMNNIPALAGKSRVITSVAPHRLIRADGIALAALLEEIVE